MFFDTETIGTPGCKWSESTQANEGSQCATEADRSARTVGATSRAIRISDLRPSYGFRIEKRANRNAAVIVVR